MNAAAAAAKLPQSCPTLCDPIDGSPPGSPVPGILQARTLEWVAISFSHAWQWKVKGTLLSRIWLFATPWTAAHQAPPSMGFSRQEYWNGVPSPSPMNGAGEHNSVPAACLAVLMKEQMRGNCSRISLNFQSVSECVGFIWNRARVGALGSVREDCVVRGDHNNCDLSTSQELKNKCEPQGKKVGLPYSRM